MIDTIPAGNAYECSKGLKKKRRQKMRQTPLGG